MKESTRYRLREAIGMTLFTAAVYLLTHLFYEIATIEQLRGICFSKGYITLSGKPVGHHIISYISAMLIVFFSVFYSSKE